MRLFNDIREAVRNSFLGSYIIQLLYNLDNSKTFEEQISTATLESQIIDIVSTAIYDHERIVNSRSAEIEKEIAAKYPFSIPWYYETALLFQLGDKLSFNEDSYKFSYPEVSLDKRIIKYVAVRQLIIDGVTKLRVYIAKAGKKALSINEFEAFKAYFIQTGAAGTHFEFISKDPDNITLNYTIYYNPQILGFDGVRLAGGGKPVEEAILYYLDNIKYGGAFNRTKNIDVIQVADGVIDVVLGDILLNGELINTQSFESPSGFFEAKELNISYMPYYEG